MTVLVTGGAGYIGSHTVLDLLDKGENVIVLDDLSTGFYKAVDPRAEIIVCDIGNFDVVNSILKRFKVESVIHFAAKTIVPESIERPLVYYQNNTAKTRTLLEACVDANVKNFIFSSTAAVYGMTYGMPVKESDSKDPISPYGMSKLMSEHIIRDVSKACGLNHVILRYFNVAGADPQGRAGQSTENATHLIKVAVQAALGKRDKLEVYGANFDTHDGTGVRDYIHVSDLANAHLKALDYLREGGESLTANVGYGQGFSVHEVINAVKKHSGHDFKVELKPARVGDASSVIANSTIAKTKLKWQPRYNDLNAIVAHAYAWENRGIDAPSLVPEIMPLHFTPVQYELEKIAA
jgi:UDP-glucose 4-epimerase